MATIAVLERQETEGGPVAIPVALQDGGVVVESFGSHDGFMEWARSKFGMDVPVGRGSFSAPRHIDEPVIVIINSGIIDDKTIATLQDLKRLIPAADLPVIVVSDKRDYSSSLRALEAGAMEVFDWERGHDEWISRLRKLLALCRRRIKRGHQLNNSINLDLDGLTNLFTHTYFVEEAKRQLELAAGEAMALHIVRIDSFDVVNNAFNINLGYKLLEMCANRLRNILGDEHIIGRFGADSFAILQCDIGAPHDIEVLARQIRAQLCAPCLIAGHNINLAISVGVSCYPQDGQEYEALSHYAGLALNHARNGGGADVSFFQEEMLVHARNEASLDISLRNALATQQFFLHFQPQVDIATGRLIGAEALVRWRKTDGSVEPPGAFLPYAEASGLIVAIDEWVLSEACRTARHWHDVGLSLRLSVNLSSIRFAMRNIPNLISRTLQETRLDPCFLNIEITESSLMQDIELVRHDLDRIRNLGVSISIDDFGVGYSSLHFLKQLRADRLKIDRGFISNLAINESDRAIIRTIIELGHQLGFGVVAEGVESEEQLAILRSEGCDEAQGFLFSQPKSAQEFMALAQHMYMPSQDAAAAPLLISKREVPSMFDRIGPKRKAKLH